MRQTAIAMLALVVLLSMASFPAKVSGATDEYESLEFFLDQSLKREKDPEKRAEILNRYLIKALGRPWDWYINRIKNSSAFSARS